VQIPRLREWREARALTQVELAELAGVSARSIAGYEAGAGARPGTVRRLAQALDVGITDLYGEAEYPLGEAPPSQDKLFNNGVLEEERRAEWDAAVRSARELRESGQARAEELLALWRESKVREEDSAERRPYLDEIGELLQDAYDATKTLLQAMSSQSIADQWPELQKADRFYVELWHLVQGTGLNIRTGNAQEERPQAVEESEAA
jgi:transcriptional regulator with XRE-family HTH domain